MMNMCLVTEYSESINDGPNGGATSSVSMLSAEIVHCLAPLHACVMFSFGQPVLIAMAQECRKVRKTHLICLVNIVETRVWVRIACLRTTIRVFRESFSTFQQSRPEFLSHNFCLAHLKSADGTSTRGQQSVSPLKPAGRSPSYE